jgi:hypothetical protein
MATSYATEEEQPKEFERSKDNGAGRAFAFCEKSTPLVLCGLKSTARKDLLGANP